MDIWRNTERYDGIVRRFWRDSAEQFRHKSATIPPNTQKIGGVAVMADMADMAELWRDSGGITRGSNTLQRQKGTL